jgi:NTP pyrophosphatase (non-canonical NTP hydrolase)
VHEPEYRVRGGDLQASSQRARLNVGLTIAELQRQVRELKQAKGFEITFEQRLAFLTTEVGEVAREVLQISRGKLGDAELENVRENLGMEIYDVIWNLLDLAELAGVDLEEAFRKKAGLNEGREWR